MIEALNRITNELRKAVPDWRKIISKTEDLSEDDLLRLLIEKDAEVRPEIENLLTVIINELTDKG